MSKTYAAPQAFSEAKYEPIPMTAVESNQVAAVGYDEATKTLAVTFTRGTGAVYHYPDCEQQVYADFMAAKSKGTFFGAHVKALPFQKFKAPAAA